MAIIALRRPGPSPATMAMASRMYGNAIKMSVRRITAVSIRTLMASPPSLVPDARVEPRVEEVHGEVDQDEAQRDHQHTALHERKVASENALNHQGADARPGEDGLGQHGAAQQVAGLDADDRDDGNQRVLQSMAQHDRALDDALGPRRPDVVLAKRLQHRAARESRDDGDRGRGQRDGGQYQVNEQVAEVSAAVRR